MIRFRFIKALLVLLVCLSLPCTGCARDFCSFAPPSASAMTIPEGFGINIEFTDPRPGEMKMLSEAGFHWVRMDLKWDLTERVQGQYDFAAYDRLMSALDENGLRALFILDYTNPAYDNGAPPHTDQGRQAFARWAVAAAKHFAGRGVIWETYNEPNIAQFWAPHPNVNEYVALALAVGRAFREGAPGEKLIGPATSGIDFAFLEACFKARLLDYWSAVSVHPYRRSDPETAAVDYCRLRELIKIYAPLSRTSGGDAKQEIPIISSEWGYSSVWSGLDDDRQGQLLARSWLTNAANAVSISIWYDWHDDGLDAQEPEHHFGTVYNAYREGRAGVFDKKPAYLAAKMLASFFAGYKFENRLNTNNPDDYVLVFGKAGEQRIAAWTTATRDRAVTIAVEPGRYRRTSHTGEDIVEVSTDPNGLALTLTRAPMYLVREP